MPDTRVILVIFRKGLGKAEIDQFLKGFGHVFLQTEQAFGEHANLYAIQILAKDATAWRDALRGMPETIEWAELTETVRLVVSQIV